MWNTQSQCYQRKRLNLGEQSTPSCLYGSKIGDQNNRAESYIYEYTTKSLIDAEAFCCCVSTFRGVCTQLYIQFAVFLILLLSLSFMYYIPLSKGGSLYTDLFQLLLGIGIIRQHALHPTRFCTVFIFFFNSPVSPFIWMPTQTCVLVCPRVCCAWENRGLSFLDRPFLMFVHKPKKNKTKTHSCIVM